MKIVVPEIGSDGVILIEGSALELEMLAEGAAFAAEGPDRRAEGQCLHPEGMVTLVVQLTPCRPNRFRLPNEQCYRGTQGCDIVHDGE